MIDIFYYDKSLKRGHSTTLAKLKGKRLWIDITAISSDEETLLEDIFGLHSVTIEDLKKAATRIKVEEFPEYLFCVFYGIRKKESVELSELDFIIGKDFIITSHPNRIASFETIKDDRRLVENMLREGPDFILHNLLSAEVDNYLTVLDAMGEEIDTIEDTAMKNPSQTTLARILRLRREVNVIKKSAFIQREKISALSKGKQKFINPKSAPYFRSLHDDSIAVSDIIENQREALNNAFDIYMSTLSNKMNEIMKVLSIIATIALPLTVISSIYGTNFHILPGSDHAYGFWVMLLVMSCMLSIMVYFFKRRGWF
jgi:magnesium transporter